MFISSFIVLDFSGAFLYNVYSIVDVCLIQRTYSPVYYTIVRFICQVEKGAVMELGKIIAINLKELRTERNLTLGQLSKISGISKAMLSDIEKGGSNPTINTIWKIANGLNVPYTKLMEGIEKEATIIRKSETVAQNGETEHYRVYCYFRNTPVRNFELFYVELDANSSNASIGHSEKAQEYLYIIQGELVLHTETGDYTLNEGDSLTFDSSIGHTYINENHTLLTFICINYYPN